MRFPGLLYPRAITALCAALLSGACGGGDVSLPPDGQPATLNIRDGNDQTGRVGEPLTVPLLIEVLDSRGEPVVGATVKFEFSSAGPGAAAVPEEKTTSSDGLADARLVLGTTVGRQTGQVRVIAPAGSESVLASFSATALPENANSMTAVGGQDQTGNVLKPLDDRLVVEVTDGFGNPVAGVPITWAAAGGGSVSETTVPTDEDGRSRVERILGPTVGQQTTLATSEGLAGSPVVFVHTAIAGDASRLTVESGDDQTGQVGSLLPAELVVRLIDSEGNGVPNTAVTWVPAIGGGTANPQNTTTDADGRTSTQWTLGPALGDQRMDAVVSGVGVASFTATATAGAPASLFIRTQPSTTARNGIAFGRQPVIQLRDPQGNDASTAGVQVTVSLNGGGELEGITRQTTDASGRATFTDLAISGAPGMRTLVFQAVGFAPVTSNEIAVSAIGTSTTITSDLPDPSQVGTPFTVSFRVGSDGPIPTGNVTVSDGAQSCTGALSNGAGSCQLTLATVGNRTLTATYAGTPGLNGSSDTEAHTVTAAPPPAPASTATEITSDTPDPSVSGGDVTVAVRVTSGAGTPTGSVIVTVSGGVGTCTAALSGGVGSCTVRLDNVGARTFTATYNGGPGFAGSSDTEGHTVQAQQPTNQGPTADFGATCDGLECRFNDVSSDPDGRIEDRLWNFGDGVTSGGREPRHVYSAGGTYQVTLTVTDNDGATNTVTHPVTVSAPPPEAASTNTRFVVDDPDPTVPGQAFTVTLSVRSGAGTPEGTATVTDGVDSCTIQIIGGEGSCSLTLSTVGRRNLTATYQGNASFASSQANERHDVNEPEPSGTVTTITGDSPDPSDPGQEITVAFTVSAAAGGGTPSGTVTVTDETGGSCTGSAPSGSCSYTPSGTGTRTITATYGGNSSFDGSSDTEEHTVTTPPPPPASTTTTITGDTPEPSDPGQEITVSFTVSSTGGTPSGTVTVSDANGGGCTGTAPSGSCSYTPNGTGTRTVTATYGGSSSFTGSSDTEEHTVTTPPPPPASTSTEITSDAPEPSPSGTNVTVGFRVTSGGGTPAGTVTVTVDGEAASCSGTLSDGVGSCSLPISTVGDRTLTATYSGAATFEPSADTEPHTVTAPPPAGTTTSIRGISPEPSAENEEVTITVDVASATGTPSGTVSVSDGSETCSATLSGGAGSCPLTPASSGTITATYPGNSSYAASSSSSSHTVNPANDPPVATIGSISCEAMNCSFTDASTDPNGVATIASYSWVFGDGTPDSPDQNASHSYAAAGDYPATLTVTDNGGLSSTDAETVHVGLAMARGK